MVAEAEAEALAPFTTEGGENPFTIHAELQQSMNDLVGIIRTEPEVREALERLRSFKERVSRISVVGGRAYNPGWHLALDLHNMLLVSECVALAALERQESRGGHTRDDFPGMNPEWRKVNIVCRAEGDGAAIAQQPLVPMREDLLELFDVAELKKYMTEDELPKVAH
jgi:succinate dehydrogenase / fumarate reductase flavoprotein subunit